MGSFGNFPYVIGFGFAAAGIVFIVLAARQRSSRKHFLKSGRAASAVVVDIVIRQEWKGVRDRRMYSMRYPVLHYISEGQEYTVQYALGTSFDKYRVGAVVPLLIDPADPTKIMIEETGKSPWGCLFVSAGVAFIVIGILAALFGFVFSTILNL